jgi:uncharacterized protein (DUF2141 family)
MTLFYLSLHQTGNSGQKGIFASSESPVFSMHPVSHTKPPSEAALSATGRIVVNVLDVRNHEGDLGIALFNSREGFPGKSEQAFMMGGLHEIGESNVYTFGHVPYGTYAISIMHDETRTGELHSNFFGIPKEGVGTSNNPHFFLGPPSFDCASFELKSDEVEIEIRLKYLCG